MSVWKTMCVVVGRLGLFDPMCNFGGQSSILFRDRNSGLHLVGTLAMQ